jgi:tetratricopeptide (TPR) repeat protein
MVLLASCAGRRPGQQKLIPRIYHDIAARDNAYFNANLRILDTEERLWEGQKDNYEEILPVFKYGNTEAGRGVAPDMDEVIKKCAFPIELHEKSRWVDDAYFLIGKANFYKQDYEKALESFQYVISEYADIAEQNKKKKKKKKKKRGKKDKDDIPTQDQSMAFLKHHPRKHDAAVWVARSLTEMKRYPDAQTAISVIRSDEMFPEALDAELEAVQAHLLLSQNKNAQAVPPLEVCAEQTKDKFLRARYTFILAQLYGEQGEISKAVETYEKVIKLRPDYEMDFFARLNMAKLLRDHKMKSSGEIITLLRNLLKDEKNREYFGLIYYAIADIELEEGKEEAGLKDLNLSIRNAGADNKQRSISYLRMADINYASEEFQNAYYYYDSCLTNLEEIHPRYDEAKDRRDGLSGLVDYIKVIETEERLLYWNGLPEKAREAEIEEWYIETYGEEDEEEEETFDPLAQQSNNPNVNSGGSGLWYFYDAARRGRGYSEFKKKWGTRNYENNWRRSDKRSTAPLDEGIAEGDGESIDLESGNLELQGLLENFPMEEEAITASHLKIAGALYQVGNIYKEYLKNYEESRSYLIKLMDTYPEYEKRLETAYTLYLIDEEQKQRWKDIILNEFPESVFAKLILDPDYFDKLALKDQEVKDYYAATYDLYEEEKYEDVVLRIEEARVRFVENPIESHFALLGAMVVGETDSLDNFKIALQEVVNDHSGTEQATRAQEILNHLRRGTVINKNKNKENNTGFELDPFREHFVALIVFKTGRDVAGVKNRVSDYNRKFHSLENLRVSSLLFESDKTIILVKTFDDMENGMKYYQGLVGETDVYDGLGEDEYKLVVISRENYTQLYRKKDLQGYFDFFEDFYLTEE